MTKIVLKAGVFWRWHVRGPHGFENEALVRRGELTPCVGGLKIANMHGTAPRRIQCSVTQVADSVRLDNGIGKGHSHIHIYSHNHAGLRCWT